MCGIPNLILAAFLLLSSFGSAQLPSLPGEGPGVLEIWDISLSLVFHINDSAEGYSMMIESVDQGDVLISIKMATDETQNFIHGPKAEYQV
ncbi:MAG: hypothetical protein OXE78_14785 [Gammaproteobacteria bacterium]|nr:hypothetical protein [Gammaproteobacteria bacterium]